MMKREAIESSGPIVSKIPLLKHARVRLIPDVISRLENEGTGGDLLDEARNWLEERSSGVSGRDILPKEEIEARKLEAGYILQRFNRIYSNGDPIDY